MKFRPTQPQGRKRESKNELASAVIKQYESAAPAPNIPEMAEVWTGAESLMFDAASGKKQQKIGG